MEDLPEHMFGIISSCLFHMLNVRPVTHPLQVGPVWQSYSPDTASLTMIVVGGASAGSRASPRHDRHSNDPIDFDNCDEHDAAGTGVVLLSIDYFLLITRDLTLTATGLRCKLHRVASEFKSGGCGL